MESDHKRFSSRDNIRLSKYRKFPKGYKHHTQRITLRLAGSRIYRMIRQDGIKFLGRALLYFLFYHLFFDPLEFSAGENENRHPMEEYPNTPTQKWPFKPKILRGSGKVYDDK